MLSQVSQPLLNGREKELLLDCIESGWISSDGPYVEKFENNFSNFIGTKYAVAVSNGTAALEAAVFGIEINPGDEVIMPSFTIISCAIAVLKFGAIPVFVDIEPLTWNIDVTQIESRITSKTKAIIAVHMYGHPCDMEPIMNLAAKHKLRVIEDSSQVHGATYKSINCGAIGHVSTFSFYANKIITTGEGGMVLTSDQTIADRAKSYRNLCFRGERRFFHTDLGNNLRMTNMQAAIGVAQLERLSEFVEAKREIGFYYLESLSKIDCIKTQVELPFAKMVFWMYCIEIDNRSGISADFMMSELKNNGIATRPFFIGMHEQPIIQSYGINPKPNAFQNTERASRQGLYLPSSVTLNKSEIDIVVECVSSIMKKNVRCLKHKP